MPIILGSAKLILSQLFLDDYFNFTHPVGILTVRNLSSKLCLPDLPFHLVWPPRLLPEVVIIYACYVNCDLNSSEYSFEVVIDFLLLWVHMIISVHGKERVHGFHHELQSISFHYHLPSQFG